MNVCVRARNTHTHTHTRAHRPFQRRPFSWQHWQPLLAFSAQKYVCTANIVTVATFSSREPVSATRDTKGQPQPFTLNLTLHTDLFALAQANVFFGYTNTMWVSKVEWSIAAIPL